MTWTIGKNCHVILSHPEVDSGAPYGFVSPGDDSIRSEGAQFKRQVVSNSSGESVTNSGTFLWAYFDVLLADDLLNPDGAPRGISRSTDYTKLMKYFSKPSGIALTTMMGSYVNMGALGWTADERHFPKHSVIKCQLNNVGYYFPPVDSEVLNQCIWDGVLTWDTSYWR